MLITSPADLLRSVEKKLESSFRSQVFTNVTLMKGYDGSWIGMSAVLSGFSSDSKSLQREGRKEREREGKERKGRWKEKERERERAVIAHIHRLFNNALFSCACS